MTIATRAATRRRPFLEAAALAGVLAALWATLTTSPAAEAADPAAAASAPTPPAVCEVLPSGDIAYCTPRD